LQEVVEAGEHKMSKLMTLIIIGQNFGHQFGFGSDINF
jgi:hypothetical protein